ncbi:hypothetical protein QZH41_003421 [Actinostola sp. cb2023]|nr:hypothetical protein QZH41_003421 [Actinostola sp. cb2023]
MEISHADQFLALDEKEMQWLLDNDDVVASEAAMLDGLVRWYKHSQDQRENAFKQLFDRIHVSVIGRDFLAEVIKKYKLTKVIPELRKYKTSKFLPQRVNIDDLVYQENISNIAVRRYPPFRRPEPFVNYWMPLLSKLVKVPSCTTLERLRMDRKILFSNVIPFRDKIFLFGMKFTEHIPVNIRLDFDNQSLTHCTPLDNIGDYSGAFPPLAITFGMHIYVLGGRSRIGPLDTVYRYDTVKDQWREVQRTIHCHDSRCDCAGLSYNDRYLYVFGKHDSEKYDTYTNTWSPVATPATWRCSGEELLCKVSCSTLNNKIYVVHWIALGDDTFLKRVFVYDPVTDTWPSMFLTEVLFVCNPQSFFGTDFSLLFPKSRSAERLTFAVLDGRFRLKKNMVSVKRFPCSGNFHMMVLNRGARMRIQQYENDDIPG